MDKRGMTLLEIMVSVAVLSLVLAMLFTLATMLGNAVSTQEAKIATEGEARTAMMRLVRDLRQSARMSIDWSTLPSTTLTYQVAVDLDGNGYAVDAVNDLELSPPRTVGRDLTDVNDDGVTNDQLIVSDGASVQVWANGLLPDEDVNGNGTLDAGEDANGNGALDYGVLFEQFGRGLRVTVQTQRTADARGLEIDSSFREVVVPRN